MRPRGKPRPLSQYGNSQGRPEDCTACVFLYGPETDEVVAITHVLRATEEHLSPRRGLYLRLCVSRDDDLAVIVQGAKADVNLLLQTVRAPRSGRTDAAAPFRIAVRGAAIFAVADLAAPLEQLDRWPVKALSPAQEALLRNAVAKAQSAVMDCEEASGIRNAGWRAFWDAFAEHIP